MIPLEAALSGRGRTGLQLSPAAAVAFAPDSATLVVRGLLQVPEELVPSVGPRRDVLDRMGFAPFMSLPPQDTDSRLYRREPVGLKPRCEMRTERPLCA